MDPARLDEPLLTSDDAAGEWLAPPPFAWPRPKFRDRVWLHVLLLALTIGSTTFVGADNYFGFISEYGAAPIRGLSFLQFFVHGFWYSGTILAILGCHELGHYIACRYYDVDASLPFFLPVPSPPFM